MSDPKKSIASRRASKRADDEVSARSMAAKQLHATMYLLTWQASLCPKYAGLIKEKYLDRITEKCNKKKGGVAEDKSEHVSLRRKLDEALKALTVWESSMEEELAAQDRQVTFGELAAMDRLKKLVTMNESLSEIISRIQKWMFKNVDRLQKHAMALDILPHAKHSFEGVCALGEVFQLTSVDRTQCKEDFRPFVRLQKKDEYFGTENKELEIDPDTLYLPMLEARINHYRTIIHTIAHALMSVLQAIFRSIPVQNVDIKTSELSSILETLPPPYRFPAKLQCTSFVSKLLADAPKGRTNAPLAPTNKSHKSTRSEVSKSGSKATKKSYQNPMSTARRGSSRRHSAKSE